MLTGYCAGWSLKQLIQEGLGGVPGKITSSPAKHLSTLCNQMVNFLGIMQNEWAGAQAFSSFDTYLAPFVKVDHLSYEEVKQCIAELRLRREHSLPLGHAGPVLQHHAGLDGAAGSGRHELPSWAARRWTSRYGDCQAEMDMVNKAFIETMIEGDANGRGFQYPIPTYSITQRLRLERHREQPPALRDDRQVRHALLLQLHQQRHGAQRRAQHVLPPAARPARAAQEKPAATSARGESTGSVGVVTINLPRIAYLAKDEAGLLRPSRPPDGRRPPARSRSSAR